MNKERLLNVARALRESPAPDNFDMAWFASDCGTPMCALGHYCARPDLQSEFKLGKDGRALTIAGDYAYLSLQFAHHFDLTYAQVEDLFEVSGCDGAQTPIEAAEYIEEFVRRHS